MRPLRPFFWPVIAFAAFTLAIVEFGRLNYSWEPWGYAACYPGCFCEAFRPGGIVQPISSYSNLFYLLVGLTILGGLNLPQQTSRENLLFRNRRYAAGFGIAVLAVGLTSLFFHVSLTQFGRWLDYMGMYAFAGFALLYSLARLFRWKAVVFLGVYTALLAACGAAWVVWPPCRRPLLGALILGILLAEILARRIRRPLRIKTGFLLAALASFLLALAINLSDESGRICIPESPWQWHAVWHFLTAASTGLLYLYYRSEEETELQEGDSTDAGVST